MSVLTSQIAEMQKELKVLKTVTCNVRRASDDWAGPGVDVYCHYEQTTPKVGNPVDYESGNGYGYTVWFDDPVTIETADTVTVNGITISVQRVPETGNLTPGTRIEGVAR
jgi:hypothetical protein